MMMLLVSAGAGRGQALAGAARGDPSRYSATIPIAILWCLCAFLIIRSGGIGPSVGEWCRAAAGIADLRKERSEDPQPRGALSTSAPKLVADHHRLGVRRLVAAGMATACPARLPVRPPQVDGTMALCLQKKKKKKKKIRPPPLCQPDLKMRLRYPFYVKNRGTGPFLSGTSFSRSCFITIACGACRGFHSLSRPATTPRCWRTRSKCE